MSDILRSLAKDVRCTCSVCRKVTHWSDGLLRGWPECCGRTMTIDYINPATGERTPCTQAKAQGLL